MIFESHASLSRLAFKVVLFVGSSTVSINYSQCSCHVAIFDGVQVQTSALERFLQQNYGKDSTLG